MDRFIKRSLSIVSREIESDTNSFNHAKKELEERIKELKPLFNECIEKGISIQEVSPELNEEWNIIYLTLCKDKT